MGLIIDNFAGGGGASTGIEMALGRYIDIAINHDPAAILMHKTNHPNTKHYCESVWDVDPLEATKGKPVDLAWFSPDCKHFSKAKGSKPKEEKIRGLAWIALKWAKLVRPSVIMLENVEEFKTWGPLDENGFPDKQRKGETFELFVKSLKRIGYNVEFKELKACDFGSPTARKRFFLIARCDGQKIIWPSPTHGKINELSNKGLKSYKLAAECIDWNIECPSIIGRKKPLAENSLKRIARGIQKFVIDEKDNYILDKKSMDLQGYDLKIKTEANNPELSHHILGIPENSKLNGVTSFLVKYYGCGTGQTLQEPLDTITSKDRFGIVTVFGKDNKIIDIGIRMLHPKELFKAQGFPENYIIDRDSTGKKYPKTKQVARVGNSVCPQLAEALVRANVSNFEFEKEA